MSSKIAGSMMHAVLTGLLRRRVADAPLYQITASCTRRVCLIWPRMGIMVDTRKVDRRPRALGACLMRGEEIRRRPPAWKFLFDQRSR